MSKDDTRADPDEISQKNDVLVSSNKLTLTALSIVWNCWLKPQLPKKLTYIQCSTSSYNICTLVESIRELQKRYEADYYKCVDLVDLYEGKIMDLELDFDSYSTDVACFDRCMESSERNLKKFTRLQPIKEAKYNLLKSNADFLVETVTSLRTCCHVRNTRVADVLRT